MVAYEFITFGSRWRLEFGIATALTAQRLLAHGETVTAREVGSGSGDFMAGPAEYDDHHVRHGAGVFISSTCYDLIDLRAELEAWIRDLGLSPVMSDRPTSEFEVSGYRDSIATCIERCDDTRFANQRHAKTAPLTS